MYIKTIKHTRVGVSLEVRNKKNLSQSKDKEWRKVLSIGSSVITMGTGEIITCAVVNVGDGIGKDILIPIHGSYKAEPMSDKDMIAALIRSTSKYKQFDPRSEKLQELSDNIHVEMSSLDNFDLWVDGMKFHNVSSDQIETIMNHHDKFLNMLTDVQTDKELWIVTNCLSNL